MSSSKGYIVLASCIAIIFIMVLFVNGGKTLHVNVTPELIKDPVEGQEVNFTVFISDLPQEGRLSFDTDLLNYMDKPLFNITNLGKEIYEKHSDIPITGEKELSVHVIGRVPEITVTEECSILDRKLTLKKHKETTGYTYYRIKSYVNGTPIDSKTETFNIRVLWAEEFSEKLKKVNDSETGIFIKDLYDKGFVTESNNLLDYMLSRQKEFEDNLKNVDEDDIRSLLTEELNNRGIFAAANKAIKYINPEPIPLYLYIIGLIVVAFVAFVGGVRVGGKGGGEEEGG